MLNIKPIQSKIYKNIDASEPQQTPVKSSGINTEPHPHRGLYTTWVGSEESNLSYIVGGQVYLQWEELNPEKGKYDFRILFISLFQK